MKVFKYFSNKNETDNTFYFQGSDPDLLDYLLGYIDRNLDDICEINLALYLFNNSYLLSKLEEYLKQGVAINIVSIPLDGYDSNNPKYLTDINNRQIYGPYTKEQLARSTYNRCREITQKNEQFNMYVFPHMYIRSSKVKKFSRGTLPYSLHTKSFNIRFKSGEVVYGLTSSNLATRDESKDNFLIICAGDINGGKRSDKFFSDLVDNSILLPDFDENKSYWDYQLIQKQSLDLRSYTKFQAPFYKNSPHELRDFIIDSLKKAKNKIYICAQHIAAYNYYEDGKREKGILYYALAAAQRGVEVNFLSQTFVDGNGNSHGQRCPANRKSFSYFVSEITKYENIHYVVNSNVHSKYIIIDDMVILTTCNFTPSEFIYIPDIDIKSFDNMPGISYKGTFAEVGQYVVLKGNENIIQEFTSNFKGICNRKNSYTYK